MYCHHDRPSVKKSNTNQAAGLCVRGSFIGNDKRAQYPIVRHLSGFQKFSDSSTRVISGKGNLTTIVSSSKTSTSALSLIFGS